MGKVVELETPRTESRGARSRRGRRRRSKTALVLGGGGFTGGVYEIGALRALDLLAVNRTVNEFDVYVGTSAGSFVASMLANGVTPEEMMRVLNHDAPLAAPRHLARHAAAAQLPRLPAASRCTFPLRVAGVARELVSHLGELSAMDIGIGLAERRCRPASTRGAASSATSPRCSPTRTAPTTSGCSTPSST